MERLKPIRRIIISIGHGGQKGEKFDTGAVANGFTENEQCRQIAGYLVQELSRSNLPVLVVPDWGLSKSIDYINSIGNAYSDWAIELHKDSAPYDAERMHRRCGAYFYSDDTGCAAVAKQLAEVLKTEGAHLTSWARPDTDSRFGKLGFIRNTKMLSHIIELGFIEGDNSTAENIWYAGALAKAIVNLLNPPLVV